MDIIIDIKNLNYNYPDGTPVLKDITLAVEEGETLGIIGSNGAGKSTLLLQLNGILVGKGVLKILGMDVSKENIYEIRKNVGLVFQDPDNQLFMPTVFEDVAYGPMNMDLNGEEIMKRVSRALNDVDMSGFENRSSHHLSFGEKKRLSIATVLSMEPKILVMDEPTSNLDPKHRRELINILKSLNQTKIIATHDLSLVADICSKVALLNKGSLVASGNTADILNDKNLLEANELC